MSGYDFIYTEYFETLSKDRDGWCIGGEVIQEHECAADLSETLRHWCRSVPYTYFGTDTIK